VNHKTHREVREARTLRQTGKRSDVPGQQPGERMKRFTIDVPESLHRRIKVECASRGVKMADYLRQTLEKLFPPK
jgi:predicted HicB family RNase H-like nuclease